MADAREVIAGEICRLSLCCESVEGGECESTCKRKPDVWPNARSASNSVLSALAAAGLKVVGREPTMAMLEASIECNEDCDTDDFWRVMFDAARPATIAQGEKT